MKPVKKCYICKQAIVEDKEQWVEITDFDCSKEINSIHAHKQCWLGKMSQKAMMIKATEGMQNVFGKMGGFLED